MDNISKFSGKADSYQAARPGYPPELAAYLADLGIKGSLVADVGAGTGIFSRFLLEELDCTVWAVEPNEEMRRKAEEELRDIPRLSFVKGTAEATGLHSQSVSFVTAAQAFHWFSPKAFRQECLRILRPNGMAVLVWNHRVEETEFAEQNKEIFQRFCPAFHGFSAGDGENKQTAMEVFFGDLPTCICLPHNLYYTKKKFIQRCLSSSYSLGPEDVEFEAYLAALERLFERYAQNEILCVPNETRTYWGRLDS